MVKVIIFLVLLLLYILLKNKPKIEKFFSRNISKNIKVLNIIKSLSISPNNSKKISILNFDKKKIYLNSLNKINILEDKVTYKFDSTNTILVVSDQFSDNNNIPLIKFEEFENLINHLINLIEINILFFQLLNQKPNEDDFKALSDKNFSEIKSHIENLDSYQKINRNIKITDIYSNAKSKNKRLQNWEINIINEVLNNYQNKQRKEELIDIREKNILSPNPSPSPTQMYIGKEYIVPPMFSEKDKKNMVILEFINLNPKFENDNVLEYSDLRKELDKKWQKYAEEGIKIDYNYKEEKNKISWEKYFKNELCGNENFGPSDSSASIKECSCLNIGKEKICGKDFNNYVYQCPYKCSNCGECHHQNDPNSYSECKNKEHKNKCNKYKSRIELLKEYSIDDDRKYIEEYAPSPDSSEEEGKLKFRVVLQRNHFINEVFLVSLFKDFIIGNDILIRLKIDKDILNDGTISDFRITNLYLKGKKKKYDVFYGDDEEIYLFIVPNKNNLGNNIPLKLIGFYILNDGKINFNLEETINIFILKKAAEKKIERKITTEINSYLDDLYLNNYIGESKLVSPHLLRNPVIINEVKNKELGEFEKKKMIDSPDTWKERADINRPWISTYSYINEDIFKKYNLDDEEKQYLRMTKATDKILLGNEYEEKDTKFNLNKEDIIKILKQVKNDNNYIVSLIDLTDKLTIRILNIMKQYKFTSNNFKSELTPQTKLIVVQDPLKKASMESQIPIITYQDIVSNFKFLNQKPKQKNLRLEDNKETILKLLKETKNSNKVITVMYINYRNMFEVKNLLKKYGIKKEKIIDQIESNTTIILVDTIKNRDRLGMFNKQPVFTFKNFKDILK